MLKHLRQLLLAAAVMAALAAAPAALAGNGKKKPKYPSSCVSAVCVYHEPGVTGAGGPSNGSTTTATTTTSEKPTPLPAHVTQKLRKYGGKDKKIIVAITQNPGFGHRTLERSAGPVAEPTALSATFDAGSGLTVLISALLATAVLLVAFEGVRRFRRR